MRALNPLIIMIIIITTMFMVLSSRQSHCESSPGSFDECRMAPSGRRPKTKPDDLGCESACTGCQSLHPVRSCSGVVSLKNGSLMTAIKILLYTVYTVMLTDDDDDDDEL